MRTIADLLILKRIHKDRHSVSVKTELSILDLSNNDEFYLVMDSFQKVSKGFLKPWLQTGRNLINIPPHMLRILEYLEQGGNLEEFTTIMKDLNNQSYKEMMDDIDTGEMTALHEEDMKTIAETRLKYILDSFRPLKVKETRGLKVQVAQGYVPIGVVDHNSITTEVIMARQHFVKAEDDGDVFHVYDGLSFKVIELYNVPSKKNVVLGRETNITLDKGALWALNDFVKGGK